MGDITNVLLRTIFFYFFILIMFRIMGKREIGQLGVVDLAVSVLIAELVAISIENVEDSIWLTILPIIALVILEITLAMINLKCKKFRNFFEGKPSVIINRGKINYKEMVKQRYTIDDLLLELRQKGIKNLERVEYALLEPNGKLSIFKKKLLDQNFPLPLIIDGVVQENTLKILKKSKIWLDYMISKNKLVLNEVFYAFYKGNKLYIIEKKDLENYWWEKLKVSTIIIV